MKLGTQVGLGPGRNVLDGIQLLLKGAQPPLFGPCLLWPHCARWGPSSSSPKGAQLPPIFGPCLLWPNGWMD